jgi:hypothetical protein
MFKVLKSFLHRAEFLVTGDLARIEPDLIAGLLKEGWIEPAKATPAVQVATQLASQPTAKK